MFYVQHWKLTLMEKHLMQAENLVDEEGLKKQEDLREIASLTQRLMDIVQSFEDTRPSAMSFIKLEEFLMWSQVMVQATNYRAANLSIKKEEENKVE